MKDLSCTIAAKANSPYRWSIKLCPAVEVLASAGLGSVPISSRSVKSAVQ